MVVGRSVRELGARRRCGGGLVTRVAAVDCGTNTLRLLVADLDAATGSAVTRDRRTTIVRLGQDVDKTGAFAPAALARTFATLDDYRLVIAEHHVERTRFVATSAARDVSNRSVFVDGVQAMFGMPPDIVSGDEEARLTYDGAARQLQGHPEVARPVLVLDIGGGSTELVMRREADSAVRGVSMDVGSVRLTERHLHSDPPTPVETAAAIDDVTAALERVDLPLSDVGSLVGVAGSILTLGAMVLGLDRYDRERVNLARLTRADVDAGDRPDRGDDGGRTAGAALHAPRPRRRDRCRCADPAVACWSGSGCRTSSSPPTTSSTALPGRSHDRPAASGDRRALRQPGAAGQRVAWRPGVCRYHGRSRSARRARLARAAPDLASADGEISVCRACPRLVAWREQVAVEKRASFATEPYWGRPIAGSGSAQPRVLIVGLAPAANGGNRTGRIFTGDRSGDWLFAALHRAGLATQPTRCNAGDGQRLVDTRIVAAVRCAPPANKPTPAERDTCAPWLDAELAMVLPSVRSVLLPRVLRLGQPLARTGSAGYDVPRPRPRFGHGARVDVAAPSSAGARSSYRTLLGCYHPSQQNTFTGKLTEPMLDAVIGAAAAHARVGSVDGSITQRDSSD